ncbi:cytochrome P450 [Mycolicibacterium setense]
MVEELASQYVERLRSAARGGTADVVADLMPLPCNVMCRLLGLPDSETAQLYEWTDALLLANDFNPPGYGLEFSDKSVEEFRSNLLTRCLDSPLYRELHDGWEGASPQEITDTLMFIAGAGIHSTSSLLGVGVSMLIEHPQVANQLRAQPELVSAFTQECLRYDPPAQFTARWTTRPTQLAGLRLPAETMVLLFLGAAGRDPDRFDEPDHFDPSRYQSGQAPRSLSFGLGQHYCVGSKLAEFTAETTFSLLASQCPNLAYAGPVVRSDRLVTHGFERFAVTEAVPGNGNDSPDTAQLIGETLPEALRHIARRSPQTRLTFPRMSIALTVGELEQYASRVAVGLQEAGIASGDLIGLLVPTGPQVFVGFFGINLLGAAVSMLPVRSSAAQFATVHEIDAILSASGISHVVADPSFDGLVQELRSRHPGIRFTAFPAGKGGRIPTAEPDPDDLAVVQFTSGSTSDPKGVALPHRTVMAGLRTILTSSELTATDSIVQWVPHYHDMGLFGALAYALAGLDIHVFAPADFIKDPLGFVRYLAASGASATTGPDFGYRLLTEALATSPQDDLDLRRWRLAYNGAEAVQASTVSDFRRITTPYGASESVMFPVYGLAEATLAVSFPTPGTLPAILHLDSDELSNSRRATVVAPGTPGSKALVAVGKPVDKMQVRIVDAVGQVAESGRVGEIEICGPSVTSGYHRAQGSEADANLFNGSWLRTGDLGFEWDRNLYIAGRSKDMIVVHGRNYFPEDAEAAAREIDGVYRKRCAAFASEDQLVVVVECADPSRHTALNEAVRRVVSEAMGITAIRSIAVEPNRLPHTTSGKVRRSAIKSQFSPKGT